MVIEEETKLPEFELGIYSLGELLPRSTGTQGLVGDKKVVLLNSRGGVYSVEPMSAIESALKPLNATLGLFGIQPTEVIIEGHNPFKDRAEEIISGGLKNTAEVAAGF